MMTNENKRKYKFNENFFNEINTPEKAYALGFWYADGNVYINENSYTHRANIT